jgi:hypothetical protein
VIGAAAYTRAEEPIEQGRLMTAPVTAPPSAHIPIDGRAWGKRIENWRPNDHRIIPGLSWKDHCVRMRAPLTKFGEEPADEVTPSAKILRFSKKTLVLAFAIAAVSDAIGALVSLAPPIAWVLDLATALLLFMVLGRQWLLLPGLALEAIPGLGVLPFWLLVVASIAVLGTPRPKLEQR